MSRSPNSVHTNSEMESEINRFQKIIAENNTISMLSAPYSNYVERYICTYIERR